jgi:hypothetical protein
VSRREAWITALALFAIAAVVRGIAATFVPFAVPEDTAYYWGVARNVVEGRGLVSDALWSYYLPPLVIPRPAFEIWLPLPAFLALPAMALLGTSFGAAQVSSVMVSSLVPVLAWRLAADLAVERDLPVVRARVLAVGSGVVAALYGPLVLYGMLPDSTARSAASRQARTGTSELTITDETCAAPNPVPRSVIAGRARNVGSGSQISNAGRGITSGGR